MIKTEEELAIMRRKLALVEEILESRRLEIRPKNERNYFLYAETTMDLLLDIRSQIDEYIGLPRLVRADEVSAEPAPAPAPAEAAELEAAAH